MPPLSGPLGGNLRPSVELKTENRLHDGPPKHCTPVADSIAHEYVTGFKSAIVLVAVTIASFLMLLDNTIIATAIPRITDEFHSLDDVGWYGSAYLLANCALQPLSGKLYTYLSSKYTFLGFLAVFELGSLICGVAQSSNMLIVGRAIAGLGSSGLMNGCMTIISACVPLEKRPFMLGVMISISQIALAVGPLIGGVLTEYASWRWCFFINLPGGAATAVILFLILIPDRTVKDEMITTVRTLIPKMDLVGFSLFTPAAIQFLIALEWGGTQYTWSSATIIGLFCGALGVSCLFLTWEYRQGDEAMIPFSMVCNRVVWSACLVTFLFMGSNMVTSYYMPVYFQAVRNDTPTMSGVYTLPSILSSMVSAIVSGVLVGKLGYYLPWVVASGALVAVSSGLISTLTPTSSTGRWIGYQIIGGIGRGCGIQMPIIAIQNVLPPSQTPVGMSLVIFAQNFGGSIFLTIAQTIFGRELSSALHKFAPNVDAQSIIEAGATAYRGVVDKQDLQGVVKSYNRAVTRDFYSPAAAAAGSVVFCWGLGWRSIKRREKNEYRVKEDGVKDGECERMNDDGESRIVVV